MEADVCYWFVFFPYQSLLPLFCSCSCNFNYLVPRSIRQQVILKCINFLTIYAETVSPLGQTLPQCLQYCQSQVFKSHESGHQIYNICLKIIWFKQMRTLSFGIRPFLVRSLIKLFSAIWFRGARDWLFLFKKPLIFLYNHMSVGIGV